MPKSHKVSQAIKCHSDFFVVATHSFTSYLAPANKSDYEEEKKENDQLIEQEKSNLLLLLYLVAQLPVGYS